MQMTHVHCKKFQEMTKKQKKQKQKNISHLPSQNIWFTPSKYDYNPYKDKRKKPLQDWVMVPN